jgi:hypothetical protein
MLERVTKNVGKVLSFPFISEISEICWMPKITGFREKVPLVPVVGKAAEIERGVIP